MANFFDSAIAHAAAALKGNCGDTVTYQRGADSVSITAVIGGSEGTSVNAGGVPYSVNTVDFLIEVSDLVLRGSTVEPQRGDRIICDSRVYVVTAENAGERPYRESGPFHQTWRIHTKYKGAE